MPTNKFKADCPRCGYDLSGTVASWRESCPLEGRCSECGLEFRWYEILSLAHAPPPWSFEHAKSNWLSTFVRTFTRAAVPNLLFSGVSIRSPIRVRPLAFLALTSLLLFHVGITLSVTSHAVIPHRSFVNPFAGSGGPYYRSSTEITFSALWPYRELFRLFGDASGLVVLSCFGLFYLMCLPLTVWLILMLRGLSRQTSLHIFRVGVYSLAGPCIVLCSLLTFEAILVHSHQRPSRHDMPTLPFGALVLVPIGFMFWWVAGRMYFRISSAWRVAMAAAIVSGLTSYTPLWFWIFNR